MPFKMESISTPQKGYYLVIEIQDEFNLSKGDVENHSFPAKQGGGGVLK